MTQDLTRRAGRILNGADIRTVKLDQYWIFFHAATEVRTTSEIIMHVRKIGIQIFNYVACIEFSRAE